MFDDKILLITGGTGSFGNAVMRRLLDYSHREIRIFSRDEKKQDYMRKKYNSPKLKFYIGDVRDPQYVMNAVRGGASHLSCRSTQATAFVRISSLRGSQDQCFGPTKTLIVNNLTRLLKKFK